MKRNLMFKILLTLIVGCFLSIDAFAQQMTVKGLVKDTTGEPIIGANVVEKEQPMVLSLILTVTSC